MENVVNINNHAGQSISFDYSYVSTTGRVACYDNLMSAPRITEVEPGPTGDYIEKLTTIVYDQARAMGGKIPYTTIREVSENFIHAQFSEIIVSILDDGNTIRFADQGPGIQQKEKAQEPGFSSAIEPMKRYIRGVGSGLPLVREFLNSSNGTITIEDNINTGAVVTISMVKKEEPKLVVVEKPEVRLPLPVLSDREKNVAKLLQQEGSLGITDVHNLTGMPNATISNAFKKLEEANIAEKVSGKKRGLTEYGRKIVSSL